MTRSNLGEERAFFIYIFRSQYITEESQGMNLKAKHLLFHVSLSLGKECISQPRNIVGTIKDLIIYLTHKIVHSSLSDPALGCLPKV